MLSKRLKAGVAAGDVRARTGITALASFYARSSTASPSRRGTGDDQNEPALDANLGGAAQLAARHASHDD
jgi:hypothetical protein